MLREFIVYACPVGALAEQIETYWQQVRQTYGPNAAHHYMPHCSLTGFFHDEITALPLYITALESALSQTLSTKPQPVIQICDLEIQPEFHGLILESPWIQTLIQRFASQALSNTRVDQLRLKDRLHLSLAYDFAPQVASSLAELTQTMINPTIPVQWELRFYERHLDQGWLTHATWIL